MMNIMMQMKHRWKMERKVLYNKVSDGETMRVRIAECAFAINWKLA